MCQFFHTVSSSQSKRACIPLTNRLLLVLPCIVEHSSKGSRFPHLCGFLLRLQTNAIFRTYHHLRSSLHNRAIFLAMNTRNASDVMQRAITTDELLV